MRKPLTYRYPGLTNGIILVYKNGPGGAETPRSPVQHGGGVEQLMDDTRPNDSRQAKDAHPPFERTASPLLMGAEEYEFWQTHDRVECPICQERNATIKFTSFGDYMAAQQGVLAAMPEEEREELIWWESENVDGHDVGTSDWPGWIKYIGLPPWYARERNPKRTRTKEKITAKLRKQVYELDAYRCRHCGTWEDLSVDHIIAESKGGPTMLHNLQTLCCSCNSRKGAR